MARFSGNPIKTPLTGNELLGATDPSTGSDVAITPLILTQFSAANTGVASGSSNGFIDPTNYAKLIGLDTQAQTNARVAKLSEVAIPTFFGAPANGTFMVYQHILDMAWTFSLCNLQVSAGSTNVTVLKNGVAIPGFTSIPATSVAAQYSVSGGSSNYTFNFGDSLSLSFAGTTGNCANLAASLKAIATIPA